MISGETRYTVLGIQGGQNRNHKKEVPLTRMRLC